MDKIKNINSFSCTPYSFEQISPLISKCRLRLFYLGLNRNGGFITKEYAEQKLLPSLPGAPIIGHYDEELEDFTGHQRDRNVRKAYGFVPAEPNLAWEEHEDSDGILRTYVCCDVYLWTGRYDVAKEIIGKPHSLELMPESIKGSWQKVQGYKEAFVYTDGIFLGLSVLGEEVEPCFEGSAFYELLSQFNLFMKNTYQKTGGTEDMINYRLKNDEKYASLFSALNPNFTEEGEWAYEKEIVNYSESSILAFDPVANAYSLIPYSTNEEGIYTFEAEVPTVIQTYEVDDFSAWSEFLGQFEEASFEQVISKFNAMKEDVELKALDIAAKDTVIAEKEAAFTALQENFENLSKEKEDWELKKVEFENQIATFNSEKETLVQENANLVAELESFKAEKAAFELAQKTEKLESFREFISNSDYDAIHEKLADFSMIDLEKELAYYSIKSKPELLNQHFTLINTQPLKGETDPVAAVLNKYANK